jgi:hypothetical protein
MNPEKVYRLEDPNVHLQYMDGLGDDSTVLSPNKKVHFNDVDEPG